VSGVEEKTKGEKRKGSESYKAECGEGGMVERQKCMSQWIIDGLMSSLCSSLSSGKDSVATAMME
jgi:hypothetical protein